VEDVEMSSEPASPAVTVTLRVPGRWAHPGELIDSLPPGCGLTAEGLVLPGGTTIDFGAMPADDQFAEIFRTSCRRPPTAEEQEAVDGYAVNVLLSGPGGSLEAARTMMRAGAAVVRAGGAGVFIDNSALAHGGQAWLEMAEDGDSDALSFAFVALVGGDEEVWTMGMHVLGLRDVVMKRADAEAEGLRHRRRHPLSGPRRQGGRRRPRAGRPGRPALPGALRAALRPRAGGQPRAQPVRPAEAGEHERRGPV
jgi:hypothetical protein